MEDLPDNIFETELRLHKGQELESDLCEISYTIQFINEDKNNFKLKATDGKDNYLFHFRMSDYVKIVGREFFNIINNFQLLLETFKQAIEEKKVVIYKQYYDCLNIVFYYTIIYQKKKLAFELHQETTAEMEKQLIGQYYQDSEAIEAENNVDYKAEIIEYDKNFEDYGDRNIIRCKIENKGNCSWDKNETSLQCVPEFSTLICQEYFFEYDVQPGEQVDIELEYYKNEEENLEPPYFTFLHLHVGIRNFDPMLVLDFNNAFISKKTQISDINKKKKERKKKEKKNEIKNEIKEEEENMNEIKEEKNEIKNEIKEEREEMNEIKNNIKEEKPKKEKKNEIKNEIKEEKPKKEKKNEIKNDIEEKKLKEMTPFHRRIYELNKKEKERVEKERNQKNLPTWKKKN